MRKTANLPGVDIYDPNSIIHLSNYRKEGILDRGNLTAAGVRRLQGEEWKCLCSVLNVKPDRPLESSQRSNALGASLKTLTSPYILSCPQTGGLGKRRYDRQVQ